MADRALPDLKSRITIDTTDLPKAEARAKSLSTSLVTSLGGSTASAEKFEKGLKSSSIALGEVGEKSEGLVSKLENLSGLGGLGGAGLAAIGATAALGTLVAGGEKLNDIYQEQLKASNDLKQATDATGISYEALTTRFEKFADANARFIPNESEAKDALAGFVRAGFDADTSMKALNVSIDLAALKNLDLKTAGQQTLLMMEGSGRAAKSLGIDITALKNSEDDASTAAKNLTKANDDVAKAQDALTKASRALKEEQDALSGVKKVSALQSDILKDRENAVTTASANLTKAQQDQKTATDAAAGSSALAAQVLGQLQVKTDGGRQSTTQLTQSQNELSHQWDQLAHDTGPALQYTAAVVFSTLEGGVEAVRDLGNAFGWAADQAGRFINAIATGSNVTSQVAAGRTAQYNPGRQHGGSVVPGGVYTVGEAGPETLVMGPAGSGGYVVPNDSMPSMGQTERLLAQQNQILSMIAQAVMARPPASFSNAAYGS